MTYLGAAHLVAAAPSHVWPLGQAVHRLSLTYLGAEQHSAQPEQASESQAHRTDHGWSWCWHHPSHAPAHSAHAEQASVSQAHRSDHGAWWLWHHPSHAPAH